MPAVLVSVNKELHKRMKKHPEIKWTQIMRDSAEDYLDRLEGSMSPDQVRKWLGPKLYKAIESLPEEDPKKVWQEIKEARWRRQASLTQALASKEKKGS